MDLKISNQLFLVTGASSGLGKAIAEALLKEGATVIAVARRKAHLEQLSVKYAKAEIVVADITRVESLTQLQEVIGSRQLHGMVVNAGGPPAKRTMETTLEDWDNAYNSILRWKVALVQFIVPKMIEKSYGRIVFIESASVKQPLENLVLSNSLRVAVVNLVKTLSQEIAGSGINLNIMAPGSHDTPAVERVYKKKSEQTGIAFEEVKKQTIANSPLKALGTAEDFASLALWLLSPYCNYITGQTFSVDGGTIKGIFG